ncbi:dienelactone hydrolase family protein [Sphingomonas xanthus]|uniref:Dienelactone hydrolase family protein n=1 Tax=Sphingomonas xanthus TaxID=2594473 RepID=A0A516IQT8_9SPHN|nr:dienelactone hydrolase family protein [Sphingomonas xanthus]QDP19276.1 dienelactone hydrolase family protein [Sphingomonas xanthus]
MSDHRDIPQRFNDEALGHVLVSDGGGTPRPAVIIVPTVMGISDLEMGFAERLVGLGYCVLIADLFGTAFRGAARDTMFGEMNRLLEDRASLCDRMTSVLDLAKQQAEVDAAKVAVIGYCFGGLCALDLARSGADFQGAASFHGLFKPPGLPANAVKPKVIAFHGWDDPMVPPEDVAALGQELTASGCDWQIHAYGHVGHGFTNPNAHEIGIDGVTYDEDAARRSWTSLEDFLAECLR